MGDKAEPVKPWERMRPMPPDSDKIFEPGPNRIFVFGSNRSGIHGAGAARFAYKWCGAEWEEGEGLYGTSYALPTKGFRLEDISLEEIKKHVDKFLEFARQRPDLYFFVTRVGCGLAGYQDMDIAPMFEEAPDNCELPHKWERRMSSRRIDSFKGHYRFLSNFWPAKVVIYDVEYASVEHAYQAMKSGDPIYQSKMLAAKTAADAKKIGKSAMLRPDWENVKLDYMRYFVWDKFNRNPELKIELLATGKLELIEGNTWGDTFWGVCQGQGTNWLGKILMEVRSRLAGENK